MGNEITTLPKELFQLKNLEVLVLNNNGVTSIPPDIKKLKKLRVLEIQDNSISKIPDELVTLPKLEILRLSGNSLRDIPDFSRLKSLRNLALRNTGMRPKELDLLRKRLRKGATVNW